MKRICSFTLALLLFLAAAPAPVFARTAAGITGPDSARAGSSLVLTYSVNGDGLYSLMGKITFDPAKLTLSAASGTLSGWDYDITPSDGEVSFLAIDSRMANPVTQAVGFLSLTFTVRAGLSAGTALRVASSGVMCPTPSGTERSRARSPGTRIFLLCRFRRPL